MVTLTQVAQTMTLLALVVLPLAFAMRRGTGPARLDAAAAAG